MASQESNAAPCVDNQRVLRPRLRERTSASKATSKLVPARLKSKTKKKSKAGKKVKGKKLKLGFQAALDLTRTKKRLRSNVAKDETNQPSSVEFEFKENEIPSRPRRLSFSSESEGETAKIFTLALGNGITVKIENETVHITTPSRETIIVNEHLTRLVTHNCHLEVKDGAIRIQSNGLDSLLNFDPNASS